MLKPSTARATAITYEIEQIVHWEFQQKKERCQDQLIMKMLYKIHHDNLR